MRACVRVCGYRCHSKSTRVYHKFYLLSQSQVCICDVTTWVLFKHFVSACLLFLIIIQCGSLATVAKLTELTTYRNTNVSELGAYSSFKFIESGPEMALIRISCYESTLNVQ